MPSKSVVLSSGTSVTVKSVSARLLEQFDRSHKEPAPPLRQAEAIGGVIEQVPDYENPEYQMIKQAHDEKSISDLMALLIEFGIELDLPTDDAWVRSLAKAGIVVEQDDLKSAYVQYILMNDFISDLKLIIKEILTLSGVTEEAIDSWAGMF